MDHYLLLEDFADGENELEDPFKYGTEKIMKDILEDDVVQRSISKLSAINKQSSLTAELNEESNISIQKEEEKAEQKSDGDDCLSLDDQS